MPTIVKAKSVKDYLDRYYKKARMTPTLLDTYEKEYEKYGYVCTSSHDNVTGEFIAWPHYPCPQEHTKFKVNFKIDGRKHTWCRCGKNLESTLKLVKQAIRNEWPLNELSGLCIYSPPNY